MPTERITAAVIAGLVLVSLISLIGAQRELIGAQTMTAELTEKLSEAQTENSELRQSLASASEPETVERFARERLGLVRPGDIIFIYRDNGG